MEFNLSDKIRVPTQNEYFDGCLMQKDVKEFIRLLKEQTIFLESQTEINWMNNTIDKLAGEKL